MPDKQPDSDDLAIRATGGINQTNRLIAELGEEVPTVRPPAKGSERYKAVFCLHEQLNSLYQRAVRHPEFREKWEATKIDGRNGDDLMKLLSDLKKDLEKAGEGNRGDRNAQIEPLALDASVPEEMEALGESQLGLGRRSYRG